MQSLQGMNRLWINRLILWLSLAGMILALHLWVQKARGFDQGCLGLNTHPAPRLAGGGCNDADSQSASHLFGVSNAAWGYAFYFAMALVSFAKILASPKWQARLSVAGEAGVSLALLYSGYLVYQMGFVSHAWCVLCLTSTAIVAALFGLHLVLRIRGRAELLTEEACTAEFRGGVGAILGAMGVLLGVLLFVDRLGTRPLDQGSTAKELQRVVGRSLPLFIDDAKLREMRACRLDWQAPALDLRKFIGPDTPFIGKASGIPVIVFFDPNCPHCKEYEAEYLQAAERFKDRARFMILPRLLWDESLPQAEALKLAEGSGKYFELWHAMFARQPGPRSGMTTEQIRALFKEFGLDSADLEKRLGAARPVVLAMRDAAKAAGVDEVPMVFVDGQPVWSENNTPDCLGTLIDRINSGLVRPRRPAGAR